jgi:hypothetical protein
MLEVFGSALADYHDHAVDVGIIAEGASAFRTAR